MQIETTSKPKTSLADRGLKPIAELAAGREHGDRLKYMAGCRCVECRRANSAYESERQKARAAGDWNGFVDATAALAHMKALSEQSVGRRAVAAASDVGDTILQGIINGTKKKIRARTERAILAVTKDSASDHALIPAKPTWKLLNAMIAEGHSKADIARGLGSSTPALQVGRFQVTVRMARKVELLSKELASVSAKRPKYLLSLLREEGYSQTQIQNKLNTIAQSLGLFAPSVDIKSNRVPEKIAHMIERLYSELTD